MRTCALDLRTDALSFLLACLCVVMGAAKLHILALPSSHVAFHAIVVHLRIMFSVPAKRFLFMLSAVTMCSVGAWFGASEEWEFQGTFEDEYDWVSALHCHCGL